MFRIRGECPHRSGIVDSKHTVHDVMDCEKSLVYNQTIKFLNLFSNIGNFSKMIEIIIFDFHVISFLKYSFIFNSISDFKVCLKNVQSLSDCFDNSIEDKFIDKNKLNKAIS